MTADEIAAAIQKFDLTAFDELAEPGTAAVIADMVEQTAPQLAATLAATGVDVVDSELAAALREQMVRAYLASNLISAVQMERLGQLDSEGINTWYEIDTNLAVANVEHEDRYPGFAVAILQGFPEMDQALVMCALITLHKLGLDPESPPDKLAHGLTVATKMGFSLGPAEAAARAAALTVGGSLESVPVPVAFHLIQTAEASDIDMRKLVERLVNHPDDNVKMGAKGALLTGPVPSTGTPEEQLLNGLTYLASARTKEAFESLAYSADGDNADAQYILAMFYENGIECEQSLAEHARLISEAATQGHKGALGEALIEGIGRDKDPSKGFALLTEYAESGNSFAQGSLGGYYVTGEHIAKDMTLAKQWLQRSAENGNPFAIMMLQYLASQEQS